MLNLPFIRYYCSLNSIEIAILDVTEKGRELTYRRFNMFAVLWTYVFFHCLCIGKHNPEGILELYIGISELQSYIQSRNEHPLFHQTI